ncbi:hypothetical protein K6W78_22990 [Burkholderia cepacia]|uniref:ApeA N-terminal domain 1-containing protein n=1 Tax=Burkholderia cepacia TaxID=292 RepID=UPI001C964ED6|nr:HEPN domain-containing protein [Burkholderia cepacia]MBY4802852.1 hypothetical protein [Burkholderia cepacia]
MSIEIDFSGHYSFDVQVTHDELGELGEATLRFGADHWPHLHFADWRMYDLFGEDQKYERLIATTKKGDVFTLFDCSVIGYSLAIDYVVAGEVSGDFKAISVRFDDINEWFMPFRRIEDKINPEKEGADRLEQIAISLKTDAQSFDLSTETVVNVDHKGEDHIIHEHVLFNFERTDGSFSAKDIKEKPHELSTLLSILTAIPLIVVNVLVACNDGKYHYAFFSTFKKQPQDGKSRSWSDYFSTKSLFDGRWQTIFENYYRSAYRKVSWVRLAGMQRYDGFWEYKALGYVSLLDKYVDQRTKGQKRKPSKGQELKGTKLHTALTKIVPQLSEEQENAVFSAIAEIFLKSGDLSFGEQYRLVLDTMDNDIRSIINLTSHDFDQIKSIRDAVAHGDAPDLIEADFGRIGIIVSKIALMLTYWAFIDFGMTPNDFLGCLKNHSHLHLRADIDRVQLARVTESAGFFKLTEEQFDELSKINGIKIQSCFLRYEDGRIEYSQNHVDALKAWYQMRKSGIIPVAQIFGQSEEKIKCWGEAFLETDTRRLELTQAYFIEST